MKAEKSGFRLASNRKLKQENNAKSDSLSPHPKTSMDIVFGKDNSILTDRHNF